MNENAICYLNGEFLPLSKASIPVLDRGFIFGDGVYEVIPVFAGHAFRIQEHLQRLANSLREVYITNPFTDDEWENLITQLVKQNSHHSRHQGIYLQITRGVAQRDHAFPETTEATVFLMSSPLSDSREVKPVSAAVIEDPRWDRCHIKTISLLPNVLLRQQARERGAYEAILIKQGKLTEGAASNVFVVIEGIVKTPAKSEDLLPGITRDLVVELLHHHQIPCEETVISESELRQAEEIWLTSSTKEILPVSELDKQPVGDGKVGEMWQQTVSYYQAFKDSYTGSRIGNKAVR